MSAALLILLAASLMVCAAALAGVLVQSRRRQARLDALLARIGGGPREDAIGRLEDLSGSAARSAALSVRLDRLMATVPKAVLILDRSHVILSLSVRAEAELEQPRRRRALLETLGSHELDEAVEAAMATLQPRILTVRLHAHGRRPYSVNIFPYKNGEARECVVVLEDVSSSLEFGELRSQFAATVSHELRTPLAGIRALAESLQDPDMNPDDRARFLSRIEREAQQLNQLIDEILFLSSLESGVETLSGKTPLGPLAERLAGQLQPVAEKLGVSLENRVPAAPELAWPLRERMAATVLLNLLDNAVKYSGSGSRVVVEAAREGETVRLSVTDDGIGIDAEHRPHIFERFYRVDKSRSRRLGGTGLGLSIVKHIVETAGGEVSAHSREGFGTEMVVRLPAAT